MISVAETSSSLDQAIRELRQDEQRLAAVIEASTTEVARLRAEQADLLKALARIRLDALQKDQIVGELDDGAARTRRRAGTEIGRASCRERGGGRGRGV